MKTNTPISLNVQGMTCSNCAKGLAMHLENKGFKDVYVNFSLGEVELLPAESLSVKDAKKAIEELGYTCTDSDSGAHNSSGISKKFWFSLVFTVPLLLHMVVAKDSILQNPYLQLTFCLPVIIIALNHFGRSGLTSLKTMRPNMDVLVIIGVLSAFAYSCYGIFINLSGNEYHRYLFFETSASITTLVLLGNLLEHKSIAKTTSAIAELNSLKAKLAYLKLPDGSWKQVSVKEIKLGNTLRVNAGDVIPFDGRILEGEGWINEAMLTGENHPVYKLKEDAVLEGTLLTEGSITFIVTADGKQGTLSGIIELVKNAQRNQPKIQKLGDKWSNIFVPLVLLMSASTFVYWYYIAGLNLDASVMRSVAVMVISCPCAMGLATPTAVMVGIGRAAKKGILIKGGDTLEKLAESDIFVFDKTGTLTTGNFLVKSIQINNDLDHLHIKDMIFTMEHYATHPIAGSVISWLKGSAKHVDIVNISELKGIGISCQDLAGNSWKIGSYRLLEEEKSDDWDIYVLCNGKVVAKLLIEDEIKPGAKALIDYLQLNNIKVILLSGDKQKKCNEIANKLGIKDVHGQKLPFEKLEQIKSFKNLGKVTMVGDGINDAPALAEADCGISFSNATEVSINSASVVLLGENDLTRINQAHKIAKLSLKTIKQNLFWAFFYNILAIPVAAAGYLSPIIASLTMAFSDVFVIGNSLRLKKRRK